MSERTDRLRWWQYLGPWPIQPVAIAITLWFSASIYSLAIASADRVTFDVFAFIRAFVITAPPAAVSGLVLWLLLRAMPRVTQRLWSNMLLLLIAVVIFIGVRFVAGTLPRVGFSTDWQAILGGVARSSSAVLFIQGVLGVTGHRMALQIRRTNEALALAREQQEQILDADERTRSQVSQLLHDRVQAGLIAACLELQEAADAADEGTRRSIDDVVRRLEQLRALDVRRAARALSPDLVDTDLQSALEELVAQYAPAMLTAVEVDQAIVRQDSRPGSQTLLGCYRIAEQAVLNSAVHGRARHCRVTVTRTGAFCTVTIDDDGVGVPPGLSPEPGLGSALTTTWVRMLDGVWRREASPLGGVRVVANLPYATG